jgi:two-component system, chemotaxis family, chemotaxis protein CheY
MRFLIVEDDFGSRRVLQALLKPYGICDVVVDGEEAIDAFKLAWEENDPYCAIFMDIMLPKLDGQKALLKIREIESAMGVSFRDEAKVIMTTALEDPKNVVEAFHKGGAASYLVKPITKEKLTAELIKAQVITEMAD